MTRTVIRVALTTVLSVTLIGGLVSASQGPRGAGRRLSAPPATAGEDPNVKLQSSLAQLAEAFGAGGPSSASVVASDIGLPLHDGQIRVIVEARKSRGTEAAEAVVFLGGHVEKMRGDLVQALVPVSMLRDLASSVSVGFVRLPYERLPLVTGQGVAVINAEAWHAAGLTGSGVNVAILDLGFQGYSGLLGTELPAFVVTHSCRADGDMTGGGEVHGTAVAEIVHEVAPDAQLYLVNFNTDVEYAECVDWIVAQGVDVINHSIGWFGSGPGDGTGPIDDTAAGAVSAGVFWTNAAGNQAQRHWAGLWQDSDGDKWLNISGTDEGNDVSVGAGQTVVAILKWDDPFGASCNDYNLYLRRSSVTVASSSSLQTCSQDPVEVLSYTPPAAANYSLRIRRATADGLAHFHLYTFYQNLQYQVAAGSLVEPADDPSVLTTSAVLWSSPDTVEYFSSRGPTDDGHIKPDLVGPDGVSNATYGSFFGTSASSPHAAGAAALVLQAHPGWTPAQVGSFLEARAVDLGDPGPDNVFGTGRLNLGQPEAAATATPTPTSTPTATATPTFSPTATATPTSTPTATATPTFSPTATATPVPDSDGDGCTDPQEKLMGFDPLNHWDFYDVPLPARADPMPNGAKNRAVGIDDVLGVLFYAFAEPTGVCGDNPNASGVDYDCDKGSDTNGDTVADIAPDGVADGLEYDRSTSAEPNPPWDAGAPSNVVDITDVLAVLSQFSLDCTGAP